MSLGKELCLLSAHLETDLQQLHCFCLNFDIEQLPLDANVWLARDSYFSGPDRPGNLKARRDADSICNFYVIQSPNDEPLVAEFCNLRCLWPNYFTGLLGCRGWLKDPSSK